MAITGFIYSNFMLQALEKEVNMETDTIKVMLLTSTHSPDQDNDNYRDDLDNEVSGTGYTAGGAEAANPAVTVSGRVVTFDCDNISWGSSSITARYAVFYDATPGAAASDPLIACINFGADKTSENGTFQITIDASGLFTVTVPAEA